MAWRFMLVCGRELNRPLNFAMFPAISSALVLRLNAYSARADLSILRGFTESLCAPKCSDSTQAEWGETPSSPESFLRFRRTCLGGGCAAGSGDSSHNR